MEQFAVKIDSKGKMLLPQKVHKVLGNKIILKKTAKGYVLTSKQYIANQNSKKLSIDRTIGQATKKDPNPRRRKTKNS